MDEDVKRLSMELAEMAEDIAVIWGTRPILEDFQIDSTIKVLAGLRVAGMLAPATGYTREQFFALAEKSWNLGRKTAHKALEMLPREQREQVNRVHGFFREAAGRKETLAREEVQELQVEVPAPVRIPVLEELEKEEGR